MDGKRLRIFEPVFNNIKFRYHAAMFTKAKRLIIHNRTIINQVYNNFSLCQTRLQPPSSLPNTLTFMFTIE